MSWPGCGREKKVGVNTSAHFFKRLDPRDPDSRIDLVSSSSIDDTLIVFDESDVLTPSLFSVGPLTGGLTQHKKFEQKRSPLVLKISLRALL